MLRLRPWIDRTDGRPARNRVKPSVVTTQTSRHMRAPGYDPGLPLGERGGPHVGKHRIPQGIGGRTVHSMKPAVLAPLLLALLLSACGTSDDQTTASQEGATSSTSVAKDSRTAKTGPCELLTTSMAEGALGLAVGAPTKTPGDGNVTCTYAPADGRNNVFVLLTTYAATGQAKLAEITKAFPDAAPVADLGDAAIVSRQGHAIGVSVDGLLFGMSLVRADAFDVDPAVGEAQLITLARTVVQAR